MYFENKIDYGKQLIIELHMNNTNNYCITIAILVKINTHVSNTNRVMYLTGILGN